MGGRGGDETAGYEVSVDLARRLVRMVSWGLWSHDLALAYRDALFAAFEQMRGRPWGILSDRRRLSPQSDAVQAVYVEIMQRANELGRQRAAVLVDNVVTQLQIRRLGGESHVPQQRTFREEAEALAWLMDS